MTAGSVSIKNFTWGLKTKKRHRSGSGGSRDHEAKKKSFMSRRYSTGKRPGNPSPTTDRATLEIGAPVTSDVEFKFTWPIQKFLKQAKQGNSCNSSHSSNDLLDIKEEACKSNNHNKDGLDSKAFDININGVETKWSLSIRFWTGEDGERLANPFVVCLNMISCKVKRPVEVGIKYKFGVLNRSNMEYELASPETKPDLKLETTNELKSIGYKNIAISEKHLNQDGDIQIVCKMRLLKDDSEIHSLSSDLMTLMRDEESTDLVIELDDGESFRVHRNILAARSPIFAKLLQNLKDSPDDQNKQCLKLNNVKADTLKEVLTYIYTDTSTNVDSMANNLLAVAEEFKLPGLKSNCEKHLGEILKPSNVASVLMLADTYNCNDLKKSALSYCKSNHSYIMKDSKWKTIEEEKPDLFEEAVSEVVSKSPCSSHTECIKKKGKRFEFEKNSSNPDISHEE